MGGVIYYLFIMASLLYPIYVRCGKVKSIIDFIEIEKE